MTGKTRNKTASANIRSLLRLCNWLTNLAVITLIIAFVGLAIYALTDIHRVVVDGAPEQYEIYKPGENKQSYEELRAINPEVIGWINVYGTKIDYPVVQGTDNRKYLSTSPTLEFSLLGAIFLDAENEPDFSDFCSVLYGHNMTPRAMFGNIRDFKDEAYFEAHKYGDLFYDDKHHGLEIFAIFGEDGYSSFLRQLKLTDREKKQEYLDQIYEKADLSRDIGVTPDDNIVMMYTCSNALTNGRNLLMARITDRTFANTFETPRIRIGLFDWMKEFPLWIWPFLSLAILLLLLALVDRREKKRRRRVARAALETSVAATAKDGQEATDETRSRRGKRKRKKTGKQERDTG